jgi:threonine dehydrogenase-like Zn-dependent dehydrogenase
MKALAYYGKNDVRVIDKPDPRIEHPEDVIVRVTTAAICGSDLHLYHGLVPDTRVGYTFGHEIVGIVEEIGASIRKLRPGDRVVVPFNIACGRCFYCRNGVWSQCSNVNAYNDFGAIYGYSHTMGGYEGGQAEYLRVPFADIGPRRVPEDVSDEEAIALADILPTSYFGVEMAQIKPGDTVAVFGCGPVGLLAQWIARNFFHVGRVIGVDQVPYRLQLAAERCESEIVNFKHVPDVVARLRAMTDGRGPDACIDAVGLEADGSVPHDILGGLLLEAGSIVALQWAIHAVRPGGTVSVIGDYGPPFNHFFPIGWAMNRNVTLRMGQCNVLNYLDHLLDRTRRHEIDPRLVVTHVLPLEDAPRGYEIFERKLDGAVKVLLKPGVNGRQENGARSQ